ncbi:hypothetical protein COCNU_01G003790 [Cocos nucifera]|uniref:Uncharacterized protein n=1 Tax=Cocos nucifera TaxID=13894 RepID=A0A8K0HTQ6_COCNU|nr:hypothetical protein COCNU_01G003790 [Cocos nucifera]
MIVVVEALEYGASRAFERFLLKLHAASLLERILDNAERFLPRSTPPVILHAGNTNENGFKALIAAEYNGFWVGKNSFIWG